MKENFDRLLTLLRSSLGFEIGAQPFREDERDVWKLARQHKVVSMLCPPILESNVSEKMKDEARYHWQFTALREKYFIKQWEEISSALHGKGISGFPLKGVELANSVYPKPGMRSFRDLDVLVQARDVRSVDHLLEELGFTRLRTPGPLPRARQNVGDALVAAECGIDAVSYEREDLFLEIHTSILPPILGKYSLHRAFETKAGMDAEDFLAHLLLHSTRHHFSHGLRHMADIALWCRGKNPDVQTVEERLSSAGVLRIAWPAWKLGAEYFPESVAAPRKCESRLARGYANRMQNKFSNVPTISTALAGSPLPFLMMQGRLIAGLRGSDIQRDYQIGEHRSWVSRMLWRITRPVALLWRHMPIVIRWFVFAVRS